MEIVRRTAELYVELKGEIGSKIERAVKLGAQEDQVLVMAIFVCMSHTCCWCSGLMLLYTITFMTLISARPNILPGINSERRIARGISYGSRPLS